MEKAKQTAPEIADLAEQVGEFMNYWGFKNVHGRIWTHLYLAETPLDAGALIRRLKISKALVSMSLTDLLKYEVVFSAGKSERGTDVFKANPDVTSVILNVLKTRERQMLSRVLVAFQKVKTLSSDEQKSLALDPKRLKSLGEMIESADGCLDAFVSMGEPNLAFWKELQDQSKTE